jgi:hypothetical protein
MEVLNGDEVNLFTSATVQFVIKKPESVKKCDSQSPGISGEKKRTLRRKKTFLTDDLSSRI